MLEGNRISDRSSSSCTILPWGHMRYLEEGRRSNGARARGTGISSQFKHARVGRSPKTLCLNQLPTRQQNFQEATATLHVCKKQTQASPPCYRARALYSVPLTTRRLYPPAAPAFSLTLWAAAHRSTPKTKAVLQLRANTSRLEPAALWRHHDALTGSPQSAWPACARRFVVAYLLSSSSGSQRRVQSIHIDTEGCSVRGGWGFRKCRTKDIVVRKGFK